jgi:hypothetical protein
MSVDACEHCDVTIGDGPDDVAPARCGSGPEAPYGWCCVKCAPACAAMFGGSPLRGGEGRARRDARRRALTPPPARATVAA